MTASSIENKTDCNVRGVSLVTDNWSHLDYSPLITRGSTGINNVVKPVLRGHSWDKEKVALYDR